MKVTKILVTDRLRTLDTVVNITEILFKLH